MVLDKQIIIPLVGWNLEGFRMGWGGGYYDIYLKNFKYMTNKFGMHFLDNLNTKKDGKDYKFFQRFILILKNFNQHRKFIIR